MKELHVKLSEGSYNRLLQIQEKNALGSISAAINWVVATDRLATLLKKALVNIHDLSIPGENMTVGKDMELKPITKEGKCLIKGCGYNGVLTKGIWQEWVEEEGEFKELEMYLCPKHLK